MSDIVYGPNYIDGLPEYYAEIEDQLEQKGYSLKIHKADSESEAIEEGREADILYAYRFQITENMIRSLSNLGLIAVSGVGYDHVDIGAATDEGVVVTNNPEHNLETTAEFTIGLIFAIRRKIPQLDREVRDGNWNDTTSIIEDCRNLRGQTVGIIGFGNIGSAVARKAESLGMDVLVYNDPNHEVEGLSETMQATDWSELFERSDVVSLHTSLNEETEKMVGANEFRMMDDSASIVNMSRGEVIDQESLIEALRDEEIDGAALDVLETEPPESDNVLLERDDVVLTGHSGGVNADSVDKSLEEICSAFTSYIDGVWPENVVNPDVNPKADLDEYGDIK